MPFPVFFCLFFYFYLHTSYPKTPPPFPIPSSAPFPPLNRNDEVDKETEESLVRSLGVDTDVDESQQESIPAASRTF